MTPVFKKRTPEFLGERFMNGDKGPRPGQRYLNRPGKGLFEGCTPRQTDTGQEDGAVCSERILSAAAWRTRLELSLNELVRKRVGLSASAVHRRRRSGSEMHSASALNLKKALLHKSLFGWTRNG